MLLTLRGLPPDIMMSEIRCYIRERCRVMWFLLEELVAEEGGTRQVKVASISDADALVLRHALSGERLGAYTLSVEPIDPFSRVNTLPPAQQRPDSLDEADSPAGIEVISSKEGLPEGEIEGNDKNDKSPDKFRENNNQFGERGKVELGKRNRGDGIDDGSMAKRIRVRDVSEVSKVLTAQIEGKYNDSNSSHGNEFVECNDSNNFHGGDGFGEHDAMRANIPQTYDNGGERPLQVLEGFVHTGQLQIQRGESKAVVCNPSIQKGSIHTVYIQPQNHTPYGQNPELNAEKVALRLVKQMQVGKNKRRKRSGSAVTNDSSPPKRALLGKHCGIRRSQSPSHRDIQTQTEIQQYPNGLPPIQCPPISIQHTWPMISHSAPQTMPHQQGLGPQQMQPQFYPPIQSSDMPPQFNTTIQQKGTPSQFDSNIQTWGMHSSIHQYMQPECNPRVQLLGMPPRFNSTMQPRFQSLGIPPHLKHIIRPTSGQPRFDPPFLRMGMLPGCEPHAQPMGGPTQFEPTAYPTGIPSHFDSSIQPQGMQPRFRLPVQSIGTPPRSGPPDQPMGMPSQHDNTIRPMGMHPQFGPPVQPMGMPPQLNSTIQQMGMHPQFGPPVQPMDAQARLMGMPPRLVPPVQPMGAQPQPGLPVQPMGMPPQLDSTYPPIGMQPRFGQPVQPIGTHPRFGTPIEPIGMQPRFNPPIHSKGMLLQSLPPSNSKSAAPITSLTPKRYHQIPSSYRACSSKILCQIIDFKKCIVKRNCDVQFANSMKFLICKRLLELTNEDPSGIDLVSIYRKTYPCSTDKETMENVCKQLSLTEVPVPIKDPKSTPEVLKISTAFDDIVEASSDTAVNLTKYLNAHIKVDADAENRTEDDVKAEHFCIKSAGFIVANLLMPNDKGKKCMRLAEMRLRPHLKDLITAELKKLPTKELVESQDISGAFLLYHRNTSPGHCHHLVDTAIQKFEARSLNGYEGNFSERECVERIMMLWPDLYIMKPEETPATQAGDTADGISNKILLPIRMGYASIVITSEVYVTHNAEYQKHENELNTDEVQLRIRSWLEKRLQELVPPDASDVSTAALVALYRGAHPPETDAQLLRDVIAELRAEIAGDTDDTKKRQTQKLVMMTSITLANEAAYRRQLAYDERHALTEPHEQLLTWLQTVVQGRIERILEENSLQVCSVEQIRAAYRKKFPWSADGVFVRAVVGRRVAEAKVQKVARGTSWESKLDAWREECVCRIADEILFRCHLTKELRKKLPPNEKRQLKAARVIVHWQFEHILDERDGPIPSRRCLMEMYRKVYPESEDAALKARILEQSD